MFNKLPWGYFIVVEGCDGAGKSTVAKALEAKLKEDGYDAIYTREPGGIKVGEEIRNIVKNNKLRNEEYILLFAASMAINIDRVIRPALKENKIVICDRYVRSTYIYQGMADAKEELSHYKYLLELAEFNHIENFACGGCAPDIEFILDVDPKVAWERTHTRDEKTDVFESNGYEFIEKIANHYMYADEDDLFYNGTGRAILHIDANRSEEEVFNDCYKHIMGMIERDT